jgi:protein phosphatase
VRETDGVRLERTAPGGDAASAFLRLRIMEPGALAKAIGTLLMELPEERTGFGDMLFDEQAALAARLSDAPEALNSARRAGEVLALLKQAAALLAQVHKLTGLAWASPLAAALLVHRGTFKSGDPHTPQLQFCGWDGLAEASGGEPALLARLGADTCRALEQRALLAGAAFQAGQYAAAALRLEALAESPALTYEALGEALARQTCQLRAVALTDVGKKRVHNEDACAAWELEQLSSGGLTLRLGAVADGMGGHASGEIASHLALSLLRQQLLTGLLAPRVAGPEPAELPGYLEGVIPAINRALVERANMDEALAGMGTTLCGFAQLTAVSTLGERGQGIAGAASGCVFSVGDSRAYLLLPEGAVRLSHDHSYVQDLVDSGTIQPDEAFTHPQKNIISRCLGGGGSSGSDPDVFPFEPGPGDVLLLCSDGLSDMLRDEEISAIAAETGLFDLRQLAAQLIARANAAGGQDNITAVLLKFELAG